MTSPTEHEEHQQTAVITSTTDVVAPPPQKKKQRNKDYFVFNHFTIYHNLCAMKVGTDGVLLGGYATTALFPKVSNMERAQQQEEEKNEKSSSNIEKVEDEEEMREKVKKSKTGVSLQQLPRRILDIGCGSGLISIMLSHYYFSIQDNEHNRQNMNENVEKWKENEKITLDAIDVDADAIHQCTINLQQLPPHWLPHISLHHTPIQQFRSSKMENLSKNLENSSKTEDKYDLITCAPPYFISSLTPGTQRAMLDKGGLKRKIARHLVPSVGEIIGGEMDMSGASMTLFDLFSSVRPLLNPCGGKFCFIFPSRDHSQVMRELRRCGLRLVQCVMIRDNPETQVIRHIYQCEVGEIESEVQNGEEEYDYDKVPFSIYTKPVPKGQKGPQTEKRRYTPEYHEWLDEFCNHMNR